MENYKYKKQYGQNFLKNEKIIDSIVNHSKINENDLIIEIGPGSGALTKKLIMLNATLLSFEIDDDLIPNLKKLENSKTKIINADFLNIDLKQYLEQYSYNKLYIIANLPYYITTPIIEKIIKSKICPDEMILMVQKEVGERFISTPGKKTYGAFTVYINNYFKISKVIDVSKNDFIPVPKVDSMVVSFIKKKTNLIDEEKFVKLIHDSFQFKRKNLRNNLRNYNLDKVEEILSNYCLNLSNRAEDLSIDIFIDLTKNI